MRLVAMFKEILNYAFLIISIFSSVISVNAEELPIKARDTVSLNEAHQGDHNKELERHAFQRSKLIPKKSL